MKKIISLILVLLAVSCDQATNSNKSIPVTVEIQVMWTNPAGELKPVQNVGVEITHDDGMIIRGLYVLKGTTDDNGVCIIETNHDVLFPKNCYKATA